jgi:hypothetical protein
MSQIALSNKAAKLMELREAEGFDDLDDLLELAVGDSVCPAICMTEGCDYTTEMEPDSISIRIRMTDATSRDRRRSQDPIFRKSQRLVGATLERYSSLHRGNHCAQPS